MKAFPFDSQIIGQDENGMPLYDRASSADEFARLLSSFFRDGVFGEDMCQVTAAGGTSVTVNSGEMLIQGRYGFMTGPETIDLGAAHASLPRIDTVVARLDLTASVNYIVIAFVQGTPALTPVAPVLTRDGTVWEIGLADVLRLSGSTEVTPDNISDTRLSSSRCGIVQAVLSKIDSDNLFAEFEVLLNDMRRNLQEMYAGIEKANILNFVSTIAADGWSASEPYTQTISADGVLPSDDPFWDVNMYGVSDVNTLRELRDAHDCILKVDPQANQLVFIASQKPLIDIPIKVKVVR